MAGYRFQDVWVPPRVHIKVTDFGIDSEEQSITLYFSEAVMNTRVRVIWRDDGENEIQVLGNDG